MLPQFGSAHAIAPKLISLLEHIGIRNGFAARRYRDARAVIGDEMIELLQEIGSEIARLGDSRRICAGALKLCISASQGRLLAAGLVVKTQFGIAEGFELIGRRRRAVMNEAFERLAQGT